MATISSSLRIPIQQNLPIEKILPEPYAPEAGASQETSFSSSSNPVPEIESNKKAETLLNEKAVNIFLQDYPSLILRSIATREHFIKQINSLWKTRNNTSITFIQQNRSYIYFFKIEEHDQEKLKLSILKAASSIEEIELLAEHIEYADIQEAIEALQCLFKTKNQLADEAVEALSNRLKQIEEAEQENYFCNQLAKLLFRNFTKSSTRHRFSEFPTAESFAALLQQAWKEKNFPLSIVVITSSVDKTVYAFRFTLETSIHFCVLRIVILQDVRIESRVYDREFSDIESVIEHLKPPFDTGPTDQAFYERLKQCLISPYNLETERILAEILQQIEDEPLDDTFEKLVDLQSSTVLKIGEEECSMPTGALVLYYLHIIQLNETPHVLKEDPDYAGNAFLNMEDCSSTPDQRQRAFQYARVDLLFTALQMALKENNTPASKECITRMHALAVEKDIPECIRSQLEMFTLDFTQELGVNLDALEQTWQSVKHALNLP